MPIFDGERPVGGLEESSVMAKILEDQSLLGGAVRDIMDEPFPVLNPNDTIEQAKQLFARKVPAILVEQNGTVIGLITKSDIISFIVT